MKELYRQMVKTGAALPMPVSRGGMTLAGALALGLPSAAVGALHGGISGALANRDDPDMGSRALRSAGWGALTAGLPAATVGGLLGHEAHTAGSFLQHLEAMKEKAREARAAHSRGYEE